MSFNSTEFGRVFAAAWLAAQEEGAVGGSGSGGRGGIRKNTKARCHHCRSTEHLIADCPHKGESRRKVRQRLREAPPAQETLPAAAEQPDLPPTSPPPAPAAPVEQSTASFAMPRDAPRFPPPPPPAAEPRTGRPPARLGRTLEWSALYNRWYYVHYLDGSVEWYEQK